MVKDEYLSLLADISKCQKCPLAKSRTNAVPGEGPLTARVMFVGEAPGRKEDEEGRPFVGAAGKLLTTLLESIGVRRNDVYITNVVKCRPPENREPIDEEIRACNPFLRKQIEIIRPRAIVALGRVAGKTLYEMAGLKWISVENARRSVVRAKIQDLDIKIAVTYHPAAALYNPQLRSELESDFKNVISKLFLDESRRRTLEDFFLTLEPS
ncbi:MAG: type-4 uracil-DNA glycosylase [Acidilobaceae archaeon]